MATLQSHVVNLHSERPGAPLTPLRRRACDRCRQRKSRCDGGDICTVCRKAGSFCQYLTASRKRGPRTHLPGQRKAPLRPAPPKISQKVPCQPEPLHGEDPDRNAEFQPNGPSAYQLQNSSNIYFDDITSPCQEAAEECGTTIKLSASTSTEAPGYSSAPDFPEDVSLNPGEHEILHETLVDPFPSPVADVVESDFDSHVMGITTPPAETAETNDQPLAIPPTAFAPYLELFFLRLYPIFPVLDQDFLRTKCQAATGRMTLSEYALLTALSAAVVVQLNVPDRASLIEALSSSKTPAGEIAPHEDTELESYPAEFFVSQCQMAREKGSFIESPDENTVMTSFFLFAYFGNVDRQRSAWYYLREAISFALLLSLDDEDSYSGMSAIISQRRRRIFWLLFVTERAFALQHRSGVMLRPSPALPNIFDSEDPKLIYGFVHLVSIYKKIDETFITAWKTQIMPANMPPGSSDAAQNLKMWLTEFQRDFDHPRALAMLEMDETQRLDIMVTQSWVRMLVWQLGLRRGLLRNEPPTSSTVDLADIDIINSKYPLRISQELLNVVSSAERGRLEAHGIGMEQKIFDVACTLSDVLRCSSDWGSEVHSLGHGFLHGFMRLLAHFRNRESQYLQPLMDKTSDVLDAVVSLPQFLPIVKESEEVSQTDDLLSLG